MWDFENRSGVWLACAGSVFVMELVVEDKSLTRWQGFRSICSNVEFHDPRDWLQARELGRSVESDANSDNLQSVEKRSRLRIALEQTNWMFGGELSDEVGALLGETKDGWNPTTIAVFCVPDLEFDGFDEASLLVGAELLPAPLSRNILKGERMTQLEVE